MRGPGTPVWGPGGRFDVEGYHRADLPRYRTGIRHLPDKRGDVSADVSNVPCDSFQFQMSSGNAEDFPDAWLEHICVHLSSPSQYLDFPKNGRIHRT
jgi:hypothetical protein